MPNITLTPVGGDPFSGGAQELDPTAHPFLAPSAALLAQMLRQGAPR